MRAQWRVASSEAAKKQKTHEVTRSLGFPYSLAYPFLNFLFSKDSTHPSGAVGRWKLRNLELYFLLTVRNYN